MGGGFLVGMWYILVRKDAKLNMRPGMSAEGLRQGSGAPSFGQTKQEIDRKLALVEDKRRRQQIIDSRLAVQEAERMAAEQVRLLEEEAQKELFSDSKEITGKVIKKNTMSWDKFKEEKEDKKKKGLSTITV